MGAKLDSFILGFSEFVKKNIVGPIMEITVVDIIDILL